MILFGFKILGRDGGKIGNVVVVTLEDNDRLEEFLQFSVVVIGEIDFSNFDFSLKVSIKRGDKCFAGSEFVPGVL